MDYFIDHSNHKEKDIYFPGAGILHLKRGQHVFGTKQLAKMFGVGRMRIRSKIDILKNIGFLTIKTTNKFSIATLINYDTYQANSEDNNHQSNQQLTSNQPAVNQQLTTPNNEKNVKNVKNIIIPFSNEKGKPPPCPHDKIIKKYREQLPECPQIRLWPKTSKKYLQARWREDPERQSIDYWEALFKYIRKSKFLLGDNQRGWVVDLSWIVKAENFAKIVNGRYHNDKQAQTLRAYQKFLNDE